MNYKFRVHFIQALAPLTLLVVVGLTHLDFVMMAIHGNVLLNGMIMAVGLPGATLWMPP